MILRKSILYSKEYNEIHNDENMCTICEIEFDDVFEESTVYNKLPVKKHGKCKIAIFENEGLLPHFHIFNKDNTFSCCIRLDKPEYFVHGEHKGTLNNNDIKKLIKVLNQSMPRYDLTRFEFMCMTWDSTNKKKIGNLLNRNGHYVMPDYTKLNDNK